MRSEASRKLWMENEVYTWNKGMSIRNILGPEMREEEKEVMEKVISRLWKWRTEDKEDVRFILTITFYILGLVFIRVDLDLVMHALGFFMELEFPDKIANGLVCITLVFSRPVCPNNEVSPAHSIFEASHTSLSASKTNSESTSALCLGCSQKYVEVDQENARQRFTVTEEELTALRIEYIKNQILKKLRLKKKPNVSIANLPKPVTDDDNLVPKGYDQSTPSPFDDFYGRTTQAIIFPYEDQARCNKKMRFPSACLPFQLPSDIDAADLSTAELWFHKEPDQQDHTGQTFVITEVAYWDSRKNFQKTTPIAIHHTNLTESWIKVDVSQVIRNWLDYQDSPIHAINVVCKTCGRNIRSSPVSFKLMFKPFLVIYTHSQQKRMTHKRIKRYSNCTPDSNECCRESLYVSFAEIGWDDWIIQPAGYNAYFCKGSCTTVASVTLSASQHNSILHRVIYGPNKNSVRKLELTPCCAATQFQPLQLFYMDNNKTITSKILTNMIVEACGCM
ncbi:hypothetical protein FQA39_LY00320 [Lamprigera yunnana]|nr:hypothetical protein FQA39_LY00320 [Lamprigera yunnana]